MPQTPELLGNVLDALDRLYDGKTTVVDLHALIFATSHAVDEHEITPLLEQTAESLREIMRQRLPPLEAQLRALDLTDELRGKLAQMELP